MKADKFLIIMPLELNPHTASFQEFMNYAVSQIREETKIKTTRYHFRDAMDQEIYVMKEMKLTNVHRITKGNTIRFEMLVDGITCAIYVMEFVGLKLVKNHEPKTIKGD